MSFPKLRWRLKRRELIGLLVLVAVLYGLLPQIGVFRHSLQYVRSANGRLLVWAILLTGLTYFLAAASYCLLSLRRLSYGRTVIVQLASNFADRLLPAGAGAIGANYAYLRVNHHRPNEAAAVVAANNLIGFLGHTLLTILLVLVLHGQLTGLHMVWRLPGQAWQYGLAAVLIISLTIILRQLSHRLTLGLRATSSTLLGYRHRPLRLVFALISAMSLTTCNLLSLYCCLRAIHLSVSLVAVILIFGSGVLIGTATPTPGGVGGTEAGLVAGLVTVGVAAAPALAAILIFRFITYWLAILTGLPALLVCLRRSWLQPSAGKG